MCWDIVTSGLGARYIYFRYKATSGSVDHGAIEQFDPENMGIAVEILFIGALKVEIWVDGIFTPPPE